MNEITQALIKELFTYKNGELFWKNNQCNNKIKSGDKAGGIVGRYHHIGINNKSYSTHRLIFLYHYGYLPEFIDHIDNDQFNNKIENLRKVTQGQNMMNKNPDRNSSSQYKGVSKKCDVYRKKSWGAYIQINEKLKHLGYFISEIEAAKAYNKAAIKYFGEYARLNDMELIL